MVGRTADDDANAYEADVTADVSLLIRPSLEGGLVLERAGRADGAAAPEGTLSPAAVGGGARSSSSMASSSSSMARAAGGGGGWGAARGGGGGGGNRGHFLCRADIFEAHYSTDRTRTFFHSSSYTANPIACAAAVANLEIWQSEPVMERIARLTALHGERLDRFRGDPRFTNLRQIGTIAALDLAVDDFGYLANIGPRLYQGFLERGLLVRPLGNTIYLMPPYCCEASELDLIYQAIDEIA